MGIFRRELAILGSVLALSVLVSACAPPVTPIAPPGRPVAVDGEPLWERIPHARTIVRLPKSADDGEGLDLVQSYVLMRRAAGEREFLPFFYEPAPDGTAESDRELAFVDTSAPFAPAEYMAYALGEREVASFGNPSTRATASTVSEAFQPITHSPHLPTDEPAPTPTAFQVRAIDGDDGHHLDVEFVPLTTTTPAYHVNRYILLRADSANGPYVPFPGCMIDPPAERTGEPVVTRITVPDGERHWFRLYALGNQPAPIANYPSGVPNGVESKATIFNAQKLNVALVLLLTIAFSYVFMQRVKNGGKDIFIRRIPGIDAMEEAVGRATEMGRPILYVPGIDEIQNIQTIASLLILGRVSEIVARYDTEIRVPCCIPLVAAVGEEVVRQGFYDAGRPDAHKPQNVQWISSEQFAFCAGTNGIMLREKPATNIFLGRFFAESLILAETGYVNRAIQIAGTAEITQLPFFIAACDYTLIGEELFAVSAYMTRDARLLSTLKAADWIKAIVIAVLVVGAVAAIASPAGELSQQLLRFLNPGE